MGVKEGDKVLLPEYGGQTVKLGDQECALPPHCDIWTALGSPTYAVHV